MTPEPAGSDEEVVIPQDGLSRFAYDLSTWSGRAAGVALVAICVLVTVEILMRSVIGRSTLIADEMCGYLNVAVVFFGFSYALTRGGFIRVNIVRAHLKGTLRRFADWYTVLASFVYFIVIFIYMIKYTIYSYKYNIISTNISATPQYIPESIIIVGSIPMIIILISYIINRCRRIP
jgi:TRAP-type C4-dicarboxylate transport system permease small subunit